MNLKAELEWRIRRWGPRIAGVAPYVLPALLVDLLFIGEVLQRTDGVLCPILDDAFIHFQYARSFAELHPLQYNPQDAPTTGATSLLYPLVLAPGWLLGFRGMAITIFAHVVAVVSLALLVYSAKRLGDALIGPPGGVVAALASIAQPAFVFLAVGGMEVGLTAAAHVGAVTVAVLWMTAEKRAVRRTLSGALTVAAVGVCASMARPEAGAAGCACALALLLFPAEDARWSRALCVLPVGAAFIPALVAWSAAGRTTTNGMVLKWIPADPFMDAEQKWAEIQKNWSKLWNTVLAGDSYGRIIPYESFSRAFRWLTVAGFLVTPVAVVLRYGRVGVAVVLALLGASIALLFPVTYTWFGNLGRYVLTYVSLPMIVAGLGGVAVGQWLQWRMPHARGLPGLVGGVVAALFVVSPKAALQEPAKAASQICSQHVPMAAAVRALPEDAVVGINDAGALTYLGDHPTWDMVGLTAPRAVRSHVAGPGAVFERMERLEAGRRPTHLAYYPTWFKGLELGEKRLHAVETDGIYVGHRRKELWTVRTELFGSGADPVLRTVEGRQVDELDVGDLRSEQAHGYAKAQMRRKGVLYRSYEVEGSEVADGGRVLRSQEEFELGAQPGEPATWVWRTDSWHRTRVELIWNGHPLREVRLESERDWVEVVVRVPAKHVKERNTVVRRMGGPRNAGVFHDWLYQ